LNGFRKAKSIGFTNLRFVLPRHSRYVFNNDVYLLVWAVDSCGFSSLLLRLGRETDYFSSFD